MFKNPFGYDFDVDEEDVFWSDEEFRSWEW